MITQGVLRGPADVRIRPYRLDVVSCLGVQGVFERDGIRMLAGTAMCGSRIGVGVLLLGAMMSSPGCRTEGTRMVDRLRFELRELPPVPQGVGGGMSGLIGETLVLAGGSCFTTPPDQGGTKLWTDEVLILPPHANQWQLAGRLPRPLAYGAAVSTPKGLLLAGGCDAEKHYDTAYLLTFDGDRLRIAEFPALPRPTAYVGGSLLANTVYLAGGREGSETPAALRTFWSLDLDRPAEGWRELEPWPGSARMLSGVVAQDGAVYVFSGADLLPGDDGVVGRQYLTDAYRYRPGKGWSRVADLPHPAAAAPVASWGRDRILVFGGDHGRLAALGSSLGDAHPGFSRALLCYHTADDTWTHLHDLPPLPVTTTAIRRDDAILIPTGEDRPGRRTPKVYAIEPR